MINPPLGCGREEFLAFVKTLEEGERVVEAGVSGMQWETGVTVLSKYGNGMCVRWDTKFEEGSGMVTSITEGTRRLTDFPDHPAAYLLAKDPGELTEKPMSNKQPINKRPFEHICSQGTVFRCDHCDLSTAVYVSDRPKNEMLFARDVAEMAAFHALFIRPDLNGFQGYDCVKFVESGMSFNPKLHHGTHTRH